MGRPKDASEYGKVVTIPREMVKQEPLADTIEAIKGKVAADAQKQVESKVEAAVPQSTESVSPAGSGVVLTPPKPPVTYRFICGCCHTAHVGVGKEMDNRMGTFRVLERRLEISGDLTLMEVLCLKCGMTTWKVVPGNEGKVAFKNLDLRRG